MIPKIIHYCWFGENPLPELAVKCIESWKKYCPDYKIIEWNESNFDLTCCEYVKEAYQEKKWAFVSDYVRLKVVYDNGGIYLDTDVELLKSLDNFLLDGAFYGIEQSSCEEKYIATGLGFGAEKNHFTVKAMLDDYENVHFVTEDGIDNTTCPVRNTGSLLKYGIETIDGLKKYDGFSVYPSEYFCPIMFNSNVKKFTENTVSIHHYTASWYNKSEKFYYVCCGKMRKYFNDALAVKVAKLIWAPYAFGLKCKEIGLRKTIIAMVKKIKGK